MIIINYCFRGFHRHIVEILQLLLLSFSGGSTPFQLEGQSGPSCTVRGEADAFALNILQLLPAQLYTVLGILDATYYLQH